MVYRRNRDENVYVADACTAVESRFMTGRRSVSVFVEKFVVEDGRRQLVRVLGFINRVFGANQPSLTEDTTVLLPGDFLGHLEYQFHQRIGWQLLRTVKQYARLADVLDQALVPGAEILPAVSNRKL